MMRKILSIILGLLLLIAAIIAACSKTSILNKVEVPTETKADTTESETPPVEDADTLHEITFGPTIEAWAISEGDTLKL